MNKYAEYKIKLLARRLLAITICFAGIFLFQIYKAKQKLFKEIPLYLEKAAQINITQKAKGAYYTEQYKYNPKKKKSGEFETRTAHYADTTFTYQRRVVDPATSAFNGFQTAFLDKGELHADSIQLILDSLLIKENIHVRSIVGITASFYTKRNEWSNDTTTIDINLRTAFTNQGIYEDINYYAYIDYSFSTLWKLMPKTVIYSLFVCILLSASLLLWWIVQRKLARKKGMMLLEDGNFRMGDVLYVPSNRKLIAYEKEVRLTAQIHELFMLFIQTDNHKVSKEAIKQKFWPSNMNSTSNMTTAVNILNRNLKSLDSAFAINSDPKEESFYVLLRASRE